MGNDLKRWRDIPDDFVVPVPEVARILDVSEEAIYSGATNGFYFLVAPCARRLDLYEVDNADTPALADLESAGFLVLPDSAIFTLSLEGILSYPKWITVFSHRRGPQQLAHVFRDARGDLDVFPDGSGCQSCFCCCVIGKRHGGFRRDVVPHTRVILQSWFVGWKKGVVAP